MKIYLAATEHGDSREAIQSGKIRQVFMSYWYMCKRNNRLNLALARKHTRSVIIDSGAHSFFKEVNFRKFTIGVTKKKIIKQTNPDQYFAEYCLWLKQNYASFNYFIELDIGEIIGQDRVIKWRGQLKRMGLYDKCIPVYHPDVVSYPQYLKMLDEADSRYVALEGNRGHRDPLNYLPLIKPAYDKGIKVHCFAMTNPKLLYQFPFYSVDSSSWKAGAQYGKGVHFINGKYTYIRYLNSTTIKSKTCQNDMILLSHHHENVTEAISDVKGKAWARRYIMSAEAFTKFEDYITEVWKRRGVDWTKSERK